MSPRKVAPVRPLPTMADGSVPRAEQRVVTADGLPAVVVWSAWVETAQVWETLVRVEGWAHGTRFRTDTLRPEPS